MILHKLPSGPLETNTLLIGCAQTQKAVVVDPAYESTGAILKLAHSLGLVVDQVWITHSHWDHIADLALLIDQIKVPVYVHSLDAANVQYPGSDGIPIPFEIRGVPSYKNIEQGCLLKVGAMPCEVIHSPGHSPGSVCYFFCKERVLISGDTLFAGTIGTLALPTAEPEKMWDSLEKLSKLPHDTQVVPGHGEDTTLSKERWLSRAKEIFS